MQNGLCTEQKHHAKDKSCCVHFLRQEGAQRVQHTELRPHTRGKSLPCPLPALGASL